MAKKVFITKEQLKEFALNKFVELCRFPKQKEWIVSNGYPIGFSYLSKLFIKYNDFREFCGAEILVRSSEPTIEFLKNKCTIIDDCWIWPSSNKNSYSTIRYNNKIFYVHRLSYMLYNNIVDIEKNKVVRHKCNNKTCCNPAHLQLGSQAENMQDNVLAGISSAKLLPEDVKEIRELANVNNFSSRGAYVNFDEKVSFFYDVSPQTIKNIRLNRKWSWLI